MSNSSNNKISNKCLAIKELECLIAKIKEYKSGYPPKELTCHIPSLLADVDSIRLEFRDDLVNADNHPLTFVLFEIVKRIDFIKSIYKKIENNDHPQIHSLYYDFLLFLHNLLQDNIYEEKFENNARSERKRAASLMRYVTHLKTKCSKLMVIRLDFSYREESLLQENS